MLVCLEISLAKESFVLIRPHMRPSPMKHVTLADPERSRTGTAHDLKQEATKSTKTFRHLPPTMDSSTTPLEAQEGPMKSTPTRHAHAGLGRQARMVRLALQQAI